MELNFHQDAPLVD